MQRRRWCGVGHQALAEAAARRWPRPVGRARRLRPPSPPPLPPAQFTNPLMALLVVAGALTYMAYALQSPRDRNNLILATALIVVVTLT
jgi:hypothetical protein